MKREGKNIKVFHLERSPTLKRDHAACFFGEDEKEKERDRRPNDQRKHARLKSGESIKRVLLESSQGA